LEIFRYYYVILFYNGGVTLNNDLQRQLEALLVEVRLLSRSVIHLRHDDFRLVFGEQIRPILVERIERFFGQEDDDQARAELLGLVDRYIAEFQRSGAGAAENVLTRFERSSPHRGEREAFVAGLVGQMREYLAVSERIAQQAQSSAGTSAPSLEPERPLSPGAVERALAPLSSSRRIEIMALLSRDGESLAALSKALGMKKGHLQFHLNVLSEAGLIAYDRKSRLYSLTGKGGRALEGISRLMGELEGA
jgi:DNA-binding transcriptional ArsR family regulator